MRHILASRWNKPGSFSGGDKRRVSQIACEVQRCLDMLRPDYTKKKTSENEAIVLGVGTIVQQKENGVRAFCRHPRIAHYSARIYSRFVCPR